MSFKGILFDLDGTLVNSLEDLADSMNQVLREFDCPVHQPEAYRYFVGRGIRNLVRDALPESRRDEPTIAACHRRMLEVYHDNCLNKTSPYDGIIDLLDELKSRRLKLAVLSNKADELTGKTVAALLPDYFDAVLGMRAEEHRKPHPLGALQISERLGVGPQEMLYLGDSSIDMETAANAGMYAVGALWGFRTKEELLASGARQVIEHPLDLLGIL